MGEESGAESAFREGIEEVEVEGWARWGRVGGFSSSSGSASGCEISGSGRVGKEGG